MLIIIKLYLAEEIGDLSKFNEVVSEYCVWTKHLIV